MAAIEIRSHAQAYTEAYKGLTHGLGEPALTIHYKAEGRHSYAVLLFVPSERPFDLYDVDRKGRVKLYVRRVFITDEAELLPAWLRFVRGVVDSEDVPLNISREMLQNNPIVGQIRRAVTGRVVSELEGLAAKEAERYAKIGTPSAPSSRKASTKTSNAVTPFSNSPASTQRPVMSGGHWRITSRQCAQANPKSTTSSATILNA